MKPLTKIAALLLLLPLLFPYCDDTQTGDCESFEVYLEQVGNNILKATPNSGHAPFSYEWSTGTHLSEITVDSSGTYTCTVTDIKGCVTTASIDYTYVAGCEPSTVTDADGNVYDVVSIGSQCWMQQNLRAGASLPEVSDSLLWQDLSTPAWCYFHNNSSYLLTYGRLYNWAAVEAQNLLVPDGWHIATLDDWNTLFDYLGGPFEAGGKMKTSTDWNSPNDGATNSSGFTALGSGYRGTNGAFWDEFKIAAFWTATEYSDDTSQAWAVTLSYSNTLASAGWSPKLSGYSIRCVKDL